MKNSDRINQISVGDRVFGIEDQAIGKVTRVLGDYFTIESAAGAAFNVTSKDIFTVEFNRVVMIFSANELPKHDISCL